MSSAAFDALKGQNFISLTTFRKSGEAVPTPVWFARDGDKLYVYTSADSGKVKRIRNNGSVEIAPCTSQGKLKGDKFPAQARLLPPSDHKYADGVLNRKYGLQKRIISLFQGRGERAYLEISLP